MELKILDQTRIKSVKFIFPDLMNSNAEDIIRTAYKVLLEKERDLSDYRAKVRELEEEVKERRENWNKLQEVIEVTFEEKTTEYKENKAGVAILGCGNDIYGKKSYM